MRCPDAGSTWLKGRLYLPTHILLVLALTTICQLFWRGNFPGRLETVLHSLNNVQFCILLYRFIFSSEASWRDLKPAAMSKRRRFRLDLKVSDTENKTQRSLNQWWTTLLEVIKHAALWEAEHVMLICIHLYFVLSTFSYTTLGFIFLQFSTWGFFFLTTNPL